MKISTYFIVLLLFFISGCKITESRGQYIDDATLAKLRSEPLTKEEVENIMGSPTFVPEYAQDSWYYAHRSMTRRAWFEPKVLNQRMVKIHFNKKDIVDDVVLFSDSHNNGIKIMNEYTEAYGTETNGLQTFVKNIGRFNKTKGKKKRTK